MSDRLVTLNEADVLRELEVIAPQVRDGFARAGGPSVSVLAALHAEAARVAAETRKSRCFAVFRRVAAAAVFAVLLTGLFQTYLRHQPRSHSAHEQAVTLLRIGSAFEDESGAICLSDTSELAQLLLTMQGLDDDSYFSSPEEMEFLWL
ncbi:MAG: hypothetical protein FWH21_09210 [Kiritimatiellaeota bacterium]|nr:hypothetical protein [Kiritimatiellota bacterium]